MVTYTYTCVCVVDFIFFTPKTLFHGPPTLSCMCTCVYMHMCVCACAFVFILVSLVKLPRACAKGIRLPVGGYPTEGSDSPSPATSSLSERGAECTACQTCSTTCTACSLGLLSSCKTSTLFPWTPPSPSSQALVTTILPLLNAVDFVALSQVVVIINEWIATDVCYHCDPEIYGENTSQAFREKLSSFSFLEIT